MRRFSINRIMMIAVLLLLVVWSIASPHVMTMQKTTEETEQFFGAYGVPYRETTEKINGYTVHYIETGDVDKPLVVFIHGSPGSWYAFGEYMKDSELLKQYHMIAFDRIGFAQSGFGHIASIEANTDVITTLLERDFSGTPLILVGHSLGAPIAANIALGMSESVAQLVLLSGALDPDAEKPELWRLLLLYPPLRWIAPGALRPSNDELWVFPSGLRRLQPELKNVSASTTVIHGTADRLVPFDNVAYIQKEFTGVRSMRIIPVKNAGHFIPWEHYLQVKDVLLGK